MLQQQLSFVDSTLIIPIFFREKLYTTIKLIPIPMERYEYKKGFERDPKPRRRGIRSIGSWVNS